LDYGVSTIILGFVDFWLIADMQNNA